ncbi:hypothetical protein PG997_001480 [Apiospora hydei]|uniref:Uncharacterized protein n=1 Tax=Apiospora hydei TaxID=1337664 RepID=A0ABR1XDM7_9PEZI
MRDYEGDNDVSWTKQPELMPYVYTDEADPDLRGLDKWSTTRALPRRLREHRQLRFMEWPVPYLAEIDVRVDVSKPRPPPPPGGGGGGVGVGVVAVMIRMKTGMRTRMVKKKKRRKRKRRRMMMMFRMQSTV